MRAPARALRDGSLTDRFERFEIDPTTFTHRDHVEAAHGMLLRYPFLEATSRYVAVLRELTRRVGAEDEFNLTITVAFMSLIAERLAQGRAEEFECFAAANPDLLRGDTLRSRYSSQRLHSPRAREAFLLPDLPTGSLEPRGQDRSRQPEPVNGEQSSSSAHPR